jgi:hypothetical protein
MAAIDNMMRRFTFSTIIVIESIAQDETATGKSLYEDLIRRKTYQNPVLKAEYYAVENKETLKKLMHRILIRCQTERIHPLLHLEVHGSQDGLVLTSGEPVDWSELAQMFRQINIVIRNNLFVSMVTCYAARLFGEAHPDQPAPYFGFIGSWDKVYEGYFEEDFYDFFDYLLSSSDFLKIDFAEALRILNHRHVEIMYSIQFGELIFERIMREHHKHLADKHHVKTRAKKIVQDAQQITGWMYRRERRVQERLAEKKLVENKLEDEYRRKFLMLD